MKLAGIGVLASVFLCSCNLSSANTARFDVLAELKLPDALAESSGLFCDPSGQVFTLNDSGNAPIVYQLAVDAAISTESLVNAKNQDWEALTGDDNYLYIGDIGNNNGQRKTLIIYKVNRSHLSPDQPSSIAVSYVGNTVNANRSLDHDFDAEALVAVNDQLVLFSKSWQTDVLKVFLLDKSTHQQAVTPHALVRGLPGVITGADYDQIQQQYILVGYPSKRVGYGEPFMLILDNQFSLLEHIPLPGFGQIEGVCHRPDGEIWFTQEASFFSSAKLVKLRLNTRP